MSTIRRDLPVHLVVNPHSGYGGGHIILGEMRHEMRRAGLRIVEYTTTGPGDATRYVQNLPGKAAAVFVWGGDGTVSEVAAGLVGTDLPILCSQAGTENLLAKELKIPGDPRRLIDVLLHGETVDCDVGYINGRSFMLIIGIGFDGEVVRRLASSRRGHISHLSYFWPLWRTFWEHRFPRLRVTSGDEMIFDDLGLAFVGNISRYAVGLRICRDARFDDGMLDLVIFRCREQAKLMLHAGWTLLRRHPLKGDVLYRRVKDIRIESDRPTASEVDGDPGPELPLNIAMADGRVRLIIPRTQHLSVFGWPWKGISLP